MATSPKVAYTAFGKRTEREVCPEDNPVAVEKLRGNLRFVKLIESTVYEDTNIEPSMYMGAVAELLAITIVFSFFVTWVNDLITGEGHLTDNPIHNMVGYNNPCAFWDQPPAIYFAFLMYSPMVYLAIRYAHLDSMRADLTYGRRMRGNAIINWLYAFSQCLVMGIFVVPPLVAPSNNPTQAEIDNMHHHMHMHSAFFLQLVPSLCMAITANYYEAYVTNVPMSTTQYVLLAYHIVVSTAETCFASYAIFGYNGRYVKDEPQYYKLPPWFMQTIDYSWFISLPLVTIWSPPAPNLIVHYQLEKEPRISQTSATVIGNV